MTQKRRGRRVEDGSAARVAYAWGDEGDEAGALATARYASRGRSGRDADQQVAGDAAGDADDDGEHDEPKRSSRPHAGQPPLSPNTNVPIRSSPRNSCMAGPRGVRSHMLVPFVQMPMAALCRPLAVRASHARAATTSASTPVSSVGWITGAKRGLWLLGISLSLPAGLRLCSTNRGRCRRRTRIRTAHATRAPNEPKSSLADSGGPISCTRVAQKCDHGTRSTTRRLGVGIVRDERVAIERRDLRRLRRARRLRPRR